MNLTKRISAASAVMRSISPSVLWKVRHKKSVFRSAKKNDLFHFSTSISEDEQKMIFARRR
jgi:hypothetical protein